MAGRLLAAGLLETLSLTNIATSVRAFRSVEAAPSYPRKAICGRSCYGKWRRGNTVDD